MRPDQNDSSFSDIIFKRIIPVCVGLFALGMAIFSWHAQDIPPGVVGVYSDTPYFFGHGGVREEIIEPGRVNTWISTRVVNITTAPQTVTVHVDDMMSLNKVPLDFDIAITLMLKSKEGVPSMLRKFNAGPVGVFSRMMMPGIGDAGVVRNPAGEFMSALRDQVRMHHMDEFMVAINAEGKHSDANKEIETEMLRYANVFLDKQGANVVVTNVALGKANPPDGVKSSLERTFEQVQMKATEGARKIAQQERLAAEEASAAADKAQQNKLGFTNEQFLKKLELETVLRVCGGNTKEMKDNPGSSRSNCMIVYGQALPMITGQK